MSSHKRGLNFKQQKLLIDTNLSNSIISLYNSGLTVYEIYSVLNQTVARHRISTHLHEKGLIRKTGQNTNGPWNKNLTKDLDIRVANYGKSISRMHRIMINNGSLITPFQSDWWTEDRRRQHSIACKGRCGGLRQGSGRSKKTWYNSVFIGKPILCDSSYELMFVKLLDLFKVEYIKITSGSSTSHRVKYLDGDGYCRWYYPDFYLPQINLYVEIKGFLNDLVFLKFNAVKESGKSIIIVMYEGLVELQSTAERLLKLGEVPLDNQTLLILLKSVASY